MLTVNNSKLIFGATKQFQVVNSFRASLIKSLGIFNGKTLN